MTFLKIYFKKWVEYNLAILYQAVTAHVCWRARKFRVPQQFKNFFVYFLNIKLA